mgnify:CR=1 FL=1
MFYNRAKPGAKPDYVMIELYDCFPQDHPYLFIDPASGHEHAEDAKKM